MTIRSLVEHGTYEIDAIVGQPTWDTIDMVQHKGRDGKPHLYSSKPPLLATLLAGEYWLIHQFGGATLRDYPYEIGRAMLITVNILPMALMFVLLARLVERYGTTDWGRIFVVACGHARNDAEHVCDCAEQSYGGGGERGDCAVRGRSHRWPMASGGWWYFALAGFAAAFTAADDLPALTLVAFIGLLLLWRAPRQTIVRICAGGRGCGRRRFLPRIGSPTRVCGRPTCIAARPIRTTIGTSTRTPSMDER